MRLATDWVRLSLGERCALAVTCLLAAVLLTRPATSRLDWEDGDKPPGKGPLATRTETSWGETHAVIALHPTPEAIGAESPFGPWRARADLPRLGAARGRRLRFELTQPIVGITDVRTGAIVQPGGSDGVTVAFKVERPSGWETAAEVHLDLVANPVQRRWHAVEVDLPSDCRRIAVEALAGPRGNFYFDSVRIGLAEDRPMGSAAGAVWALKSLALAMLLAPLGAWLWSRGRALPGTWRRPLPAGRASAAPAWSSPMSRAVWVVPPLLMAPSLVWISLDRGVFWGDESWLAGPAVTLFCEMLRSPSRWLRGMLSVYAIKPPGVGWLGQFFVPVGLGLGSIDLGLLLFNVLTQAGTLVLVFRAIWHLSEGSLVSAAGASLFVAGAPLFVALSHRFHVEPLQTLSVAWFVWIVARAPAWTRRRLGAHLLLATTVAVLAKASSPLYCILPGLLAVAGFFRRPASGVESSRERRSDLAMWVVGTGAAGMALAWYLRNLRPVLAHVAFSSSGQAAQTWGKRDTFVNAFGYWLDAVRRCFGVTETWVLLAAVLAAGVLACSRRPGWPLPRFSLCAVVAAVQVAVVLAAFSMNDNRETRYLEGLLPLLAVIVGWCLALVPWKPLAWALAVVLAGQWALVHAHALGWMSQPAGRFLPMRGLDRDPGRAAVVDALVDRTCRGEGPPARYENVLASEEIWVNNAIVNYVAAKRAAPWRQPGCRYRDVGGNFFGLDLDPAWTDLLDRPLGHFIVWDPATQPPAEHTYNRALNAENLPRLVQRARSVGDFSEEAPLAEDRRLLIFRRAPWKGARREGEPSEP